MENKNFFTTTAWIITIVLIVICCCCFIVLAGGLGGLYYIGSQATPFAPVSTPFNFNFDTSTPTSIPTPVEITRVPVENIPTDTLKTLETSIVPVNDLRDLACRLENKCNIPETLPSGPYKGGDKSQFWLTNTDNHESFQIKATLEYVTDHAYFWVEDSVKYDQGEAKKLVDTF